MIHISNSNIPQAILRLGSNKIFLLIERDDDTKVCLSTLSRTNIDYARGKVCVVYVHVFENDNDANPSITRT